MVSIFLGLTTANLLVLCGVFGLGLFAVGADGRPSDWYGLHVGIGIGAGLLTVLTHLAVYTYMMATTKWLAAATDKAGVAVSRWVAPARERKRRSLPLVMGPIVITMCTMFAGAAADPTVNPWWSGQVHMAIGMAAIVVNGLCAFLEYRLIDLQGADVDRASRWLGKPTDEGDGVGAATA